MLLFKPDSSDPDEVARQMCARASLVGKPFMAHIGTVAIFAKPGQASQDVATRFRQEVERRKQWQDRRKAPRDDGSERRKPESSK